MSRLRLFLLSTMLFLSACSASYFQVSPDDYRARVHRLGVVPLLVDEGSAISHPQRTAVIDLLHRAAAGKETVLAERLSASRDYTTVMAIPAPPEQLARLIDGAAMIEAGNESFRRYRPNPGAVGELCRANGVDALLLVVLAGVERQEKRWDRLHLNYLQGNGNVILAGALVVAANGSILWEFPGNSTPFLDLQFAAFDEAVANRSEQVEVRYITPAGLERTLAEPDRTAFGGSDFPQRFRILFDTLAEGLRPGLHLGAAAAPAPAK